jgi:hypothetical protein
VYRAQVTSVFSFEQVPGTYSLKHKLPFPVDESTGDAKYNKTQKLLTVTLDVLPWRPDEIAEELARLEREAEALRAKQEEEQMQEKERKEKESQQVVKKGFLTPSHSHGGEHSAEAAQQGPAVAEQTPPKPIGEAHGGKPLIQEIESASSDQGPAHVAAHAGKRSTAGGAHQQAETESAAPPPLNFRQNDQNVTIIVRVSDIDEGSLCVDYGRSRVVLDFGAGEPRTRYRHTIHLWGDIEPLHCR